MKKLVGLMMASVSLPAFASESQATGYGSGLAAMEKAGHNGGHNGIAVRW